MMSSFVGRFLASTIGRMHQETASQVCGKLSSSVFASHYSYGKGGAVRGTSLFSMMQQQQLRLKHTMKTHKGIAKRFKVRGKGNLRRTCAGRQHNTGFKPRRRINKLGLGGSVKPKSIDRKIKICLGILGKQKR